MLLISARSRALPSLTFLTFKGIGSSFTALPKSGGWLTGSGLNALPEAYISTQPKHSIFSGDTAQNNKSTVFCAHSSYNSFVHQAPTPAHNALALGCGYLSHAQ